MRIEKTGPFLSLADLAEQSLRRKIKVSNLPKEMTSKKVYEKMKLLHEITLKPSELNYETLDEAIGYTGIRAVGHSCLPLFSIQRLGMSQAITLSIEHEGLKLLESVQIGIRCYRQGCEDVRFATRICDQQTAITTAFDGLNGFGWIRWDRGTTIKSVRIDEQNGICKCPRCGANFGHVVFVKTMIGKKLAFGCEEI